MVARELKDGIKELVNYVPLIQNFIAPIFNLAEQLQEQIGNINIKKDEYSKFGIWKTVFCLNDQTQSMHTKNDCSYNVITVPKQDEPSLQSQTNFHLKLNNEHSIFLEMNHPITFMFSGKNLSHQ